ncbi:MAG: D-tyrosyl-tRNA(Tyr) deacylase [Myxococcales bacterium]|nr:D-tyrosyl-tRNA(Tyr) deacylase [Myxococcales bacterium]
MKTVIQRVSRASVRVDGEVVGEIGRGILVLVGVERGDGVADAHMTARKIAGMRIFPGAKPMDRSVAEIGGAVLVISQFTLAGNVRKGRRPSFDRAEDPERAERLYMTVVEELRSLGLPTQTGRFAAHMEVELVNEGPVTIMIFTEGGVIL